MTKALSFIIAIILMCPLKASCQQREVMTLVSNKFRNGDTILIAKEYKEWSRAARKGIPAMRFYKGGTDKAANVYAVYNWHAVVDKRGLAPEGWHIPAYNELNDSTTTLMRAIKYDSTIIYKNYYEHPMFRGLFNL